MKHKKVIKNILIILIVFLVLIILLPMIPYKTSINIGNRKYTKIKVYFSSMDGMMLETGQEYLGISGGENGIDNFLKGNTPYKELNSFEKGLGGGTYNLYGNLKEDSNGRKYFYVEKWYPAGLYYIPLMDTNFWEKKIESRYFKVLKPAILSIVVLGLVLFVISIEKTDLYDRKE